MEKQSTKQLRILPLCLIAIVAIFTFGFLIKMSFEMRAEEYYQDHQGKIYGREYIENGIIFDVPKTGDPSREAAVVKFPNHAVIPSYISVEGVKYKVTEVRFGAPQTFFGDTSGWVTLPPTLKRCTLEAGTARRINKTTYAYTLYGVANVRISNLDSFLNMTSYQQMYPHATAFPKNEEWRLYVNDTLFENRDIVYPEGSPIGTNINYMYGIKYIVIPASDTARTKMIDMKVDAYGLPDNHAKALKFKLDSGYNLRNYGIIADSIYLPRKLDTLKGVGGNYKYIAQWPDNLKCIRSTDGLNRLYLSDIPKSVINLFGFFSTNETLTIPPRIQVIGGFIDIEGEKENDQNIKIEDSDDTLIVMGIDITKHNPYKNPQFYIGRNIRYTMDEYRIKPINKMNDKTATIIIGPKVTEMNDRFEVDLNGNKPKYIVCKGLTPPNFKVTLPEIWNWKFETILIVPEAAEAAYRAHPVWKYFYTILTDNVDSINVEKEIKTEQWYSLDGQLLNRPEPAKINVRFVKYTDGTVERQKIAVP